jgi:hypothetical protein
MPALRSRDEQAPLEHRHPVGLGDDLRRHLGRQLPAGDMLGQGLDLGGRQAVERDAGDVREAGPGRLVFRPEGEDRQHRQGADPLDRQIEHFERGRIGQWTSSNSINTGFCRASASS